MLYFKRFLPVLFGIGVLTVASSAQATLFTYSYAGLTFTDINGAQTTSNSISGEFTIDVADNASISHLSSNSLLVGASFTDGIQTFTDADSTLTFAFNTDLNGNILADSDLNLLLVSDSNSDNFIEIGNLETTFVPVFGDVAVGPDDETTGLSEQIGTFALVSPIPEPGALALLGIGLVGLGAIRFRCIAD